MQLYAENDNNRTPVAGFEATSELHTLCDNAKKDDVQSWEAIRRWLSSNPASARYGVEYQGEYDTTPLHLACRNCPPVEIVLGILDASPETVGWIDAFHWLPLHYACAYGASEEVLQVLSDAYPPSKTAIDKRGRTPLHFALGSATRQASATTVAILSDSGAAGCADENGSLPLHYACAYGATERVLKILLSVIPTSTTAVDFKGRTPLHFAMGNADRATSPAVVKLLLSLNPDVINDTDNDGQLPLHLLAAQAKKTSVEDSHDAKVQRDSAMACLDTLLKASPMPTADFLTALQSLPEWLLEYAVVSEEVQKVLNAKIALRFPTSILLLDAYFLFIIIFSFNSAAMEYLDIQEKNSDKTKSDEFQYYQLGMYLGIVYFGMREVIQMLSLITLDTFNAWYGDLGNGLDVSLIAVTLACSFIMEATNARTEEEMETVQIFFSVAIFIMWMSVLSFLKSTLIDFAVFVGGVFYVGQRLAAFIMSLAIILLAFSQMFVTIFQNTDICPEHHSDNKLQDLIKRNKVIVGVTNRLIGDHLPIGFDGTEFCDADLTYWFSAAKPIEPAIITTPAPTFSDMNEEQIPVPSMAPSSFNDTLLTWNETGRDFCISQYSALKGDSSPFCSFTQAFLRSYNMLIGEVDENDFKSDPVATTYYYIFVFMVVLILASVLIAIVTDSYEIIKDQRAEIVFWNNRLDFVAEMDSISSGVRKVKFALFGEDEPDPAHEAGAPVDSFVSRDRTEGGGGEGSSNMGESLWAKLVELFNDEQLNITTFEFWCYTVFRVLALILIFPAWLLLGVFTAGWLWPPQVRKWLFVQQFTKRGVDPSVEFETKTKITLEELTKENEALMEEITQITLVLKSISEDLPQGAY